MVDVWALLLSGTGYVCTVNIVSFEVHIKGDHLFCVAISHDCRGTAAPIPYDRLCVSSEQRSVLQVVGFEEFEFEFGLGRISPWYPCVQRRRMANSQSEIARN